MEFGILLVVALLVTYGIINEIKRVALVIVAAGGAALYFLVLKKKA